MAMSVVPLSKPIEAHGQTITEITLREPTTEDVMAEGFPTLMVPSADGKTVCVEVRANVVGRYIARLGAIPPSSVKKLSIADFQRCLNEVMSFFGEADGEASSNSPSESST